MISTLLILFALSAAVVVWRISFWYRQGFKLQTVGGYIPPEASKIEKLIWYWTCRGISRLAFGPVKIIGRENAWFNGRLVILPNHQHGLDFLVVRMAMPYSYRAIGAAKEMKSWRSGPAAFIGATAVPVMGGKATGNAQIVLEHTADVVSLSRYGKVMLFPQGKLVWDNILRPEEFRTGAVRMMGMVDERTEHAPLAALPVAVHLWTRGELTLTRRCVHWLWRRYFSDYNSSPKFGATVVIGKPIPFESLPKEARPATEQIRQVIQALLDEAIANSPDA